MIESEALKLGKGWGPIGIGGEEEGIMGLSF